MATKPPIMIISDDDREALVAALRTAIHNHERETVLYAETNAIIGGGLFKGDYQRLLTTHNALKESGHGFTFVEMNEETCGRWRALIERLTAETKPITKKKGRK